jgi:hypothetical protein
MKAFVLPLFAAAAVLSGCVVVPAEPGVVVGPPRAYVRPPAVFVVPGGGYYRYRDHHGYRRDQRDWYPRHPYRD